MVMYGDNKTADRCKAGRILSIERKVELRSSPLVREDWVERTNGETRPTVYGSLRSLKITPETILRKKHDLMSLSTNLGYSDNRCSIWVNIFLPTFSFTTSLYLVPYLSGFIIRNLDLCILVIILIVPGLG